MKPPPRTEFIESLERVRRLGGTARWRDDEGRIYEWDGLHEELEKYTRHGRHLGAVDPRTGKIIKQPVKGRKIDV